jgi:Gpi18-like mannosyltransferase
VAAFVLANLFSLLGALLLYLLLEPRYGNSVAFGSTVLLQGSPFGLFFCVPFTESLFFLLSVFAALGVERRHGLCAAAGLGLAIVTRSTGVAVSLLVAGWLIRSAQTTPRPRVSPARMLVWSLVAAAPPVAFVTYLQQKIGDPLIVNAVIKGWSGNYGFESPLTNLVQNTWGTFLNFSSLPWHAYNRSQLDFLVLLVSLALLVLGVRRLPPHHVLFAAGVLAIPLLTHDLMSFGRYALVAWPLASVPLLVVAPRYRRWLLWTLLPAMLVGQLGLVARFVNWQWVG